MVSTSAQGKQPSCEHRQHVLPKLNEQSLETRDRKSSAGGGKKYWRMVRILGVFEDEDDYATRSAKRTLLPPAFLAYKSGGVCMWFDNPLLEVRILIIFGLAVDTYIATTRL
jgi:hypothetical protein